MSWSNRLEPVNEVSPAGPAPYPLNLFMNCFWNSEYFHASVAYLAHLEFRVNRWYVSCRLFILKSKLFSPAFNFFDQIFIYRSCILVAAGNPRQLAAILAGNRNAYTVGPTKKG